ncbi:CaiB/BaiF CoA-transferase family protein [Acuticoccus sp. I52.16.1]|uniref:CaiB/BaiF CoA transferase family protein n=1 Tax=Acuticoccus sp. I52.16.1 TaxID=2928472 RepID=UPI001FD301A3|nr:CaiB/BaiF CoA-transferase family protein [Acuticoccus sp. I52.16.1]UOM34779.1 CoA transferase [Acuticoccus sp. I52.16.1]
MYPLEGIKVLDLSRVLAGPSSTQTLADLGAEVWKIEAPGNGDDTRGWMPPQIGGESTYFMAANRSKKSVTIDLKSPEGLAQVLALAAQADVLVENFRLGALDRMGLGYEAVHRVNPRLIYCSISGYGRTGPRAAEPGYDFVIQAESGLMSITGEPDGDPMKLGVAITDLVAGMNAVQGVLAALIARERTGRGQHIDISLFDCAVAALANVATGHLQTGGGFKRFGNAHPTVVPYQTFDTADGSLCLAVGNDGQFAKLCRQVIDRPDMAEDPRFVRNRDRVENRRDLIPPLAAIFTTKPTAHWIAALKTAGVPCGEVRSVEQVFDAPEIAARNVVLEIPDEKHGTLRLVASPLRLSETPPRTPLAPPRLGEHTNEVLSRYAKVTG